MYSCQLLIIEDHGKKEGEFILFVEITRGRTYFCPVDRLRLFSHQNRRYENIFIWLMLFSWGRDKQNAGEKPKPGKKEPEPKPGKKELEPKPKPERKGRREPQEPREPKNAFGRKHMKPIYLSL